MQAMTRRTAGLGLLALVTTACRSGPAEIKSGAIQSTPSSIPTTGNPGPTPVPSNDAILQILRTRIDVQRQSRGIVVALVGPRLQRTVAHGVLGADLASVDADTLYPIASITKLFTALLLADAVVKGEVALDQPLSRYWPELKMPAGAERQITLLDLATHTSGLPIYPDDYPPETAPAARAAYGREQLYAALASQKLRTPPGSEWRYSDLGPQLIAEVLSRRSGIEFEILLQRRICRPLGMESTTFAPPAAMSPRLTRSHDGRLRPIAEHRELALAAAGELYSTAADLQRLMAAFMGIHRSPLAPAMASMLVTRKAAPPLNGEQALGLQIWRFGSAEVMGHNGNKAGAASSMLWRSDLGAIVLSNAATPVDDIARHLLVSQLPLARPMKSVEVDAAALQRYVGRYKERTIGVIFAISLEGDELMFEPVGQAPKIAMAPEQQDAFNIPRLRARVVFRSPDTVWVNFLGREYLADRME